MAAGRAWSLECCADWMLFFSLHWRSVCSSCRLYRWLWLTDGTGCLRTEVLRIGGVSVGSGGHSPTEDLLLFPFRES